MKSIPVVMCIDVEPDEREIESTVATNWAGFEESLRFFANLRPQLEQATGAPVRFNWFFRMDPQVEQAYGDAAWVVKRYAGAIEELEAAGDELGLHSHAWRWEVPSGRWVADHGDQNWVNHCLHMSFEAYRAALGRPCLLFRFGDRWMNNGTMAVLESLGVKVDLTVEPGRSTEPMISEAHTGSLPDYSTVPTWPYRPARDDFRKRGWSTGRNLWVLPLSTGRPWPPGPFSLITRAARAMGLDMQRPVETTPLYFCLENQRFRIIADNLLAVWRKRYLAPVVRTDAAVSPERRANLRYNAEFLLSHQMVRQFRFVKPDEAIRLLG